MTETQPDLAHPRVPAPWTDLIEDYEAFHEHATATGDFDPVYPVLAQIADDNGWGVEHTLWACLVYVAYYDLGSALRVVAEAPEPTIPRGELLRLPCATERRAHRDPRQLARHLTGVVEAANHHGGLLAWLTDGIRDVEAWQRYPAAFAHLQTLHGNGRWAAYKTCELLAFVLAPFGAGFADLCPTDMGHAHSSGPRQGLALLHPDLPQGNSRGEVAALNEISARLVAQLGRAGLWAPISVVETTLCDFHALAAGRYYVGHDIDQMQGQLTRTPSALTEAAFAAREAVLPPCYLGELCGWQGVDKARRGVYASDGRLLLRGSGECS
ncbi:ADDT family thymidine hypermodification transferase [Actinopolyspora erythraea]|uniref:ADDT family thymidine hypermodification transferase n=1 Tax=Actinopolyspora erythraea TaxID=414996 RepID=UPI000A9FBD60|nr:hypothetical protein [Actinopolyspora erythraea]